MRGVLLCFLFGVFVLGEGVTGDMGDPPIQKQTKLTEDPVKPANPVNPSNPMKPANPVNPANPVKPVNPTNTVKPVNPPNPVNPTSPVKPATPANPVKSANPVNPSIPVKPAGIKGQKFTALASSGSTPCSVQDSLFHMALVLLGALLFFYP